MARPSQKAPPPKEPTEQEIEQDELGLSSASLEEQAKEKFPPLFYRQLKKIAYYTAKVGLTLEEACVLVDIDYEKFRDEMKLDSLITKIIRIKELEFKKDMLHTITQRARSGDDKVAAWLLERKFPDEFGTKKGKGESEGSGDVIFEAIQFIRRNSDSNPLVSEAAGRAVVIKKNVAASVEHRIDDILNAPMPQVEEPKKP